MILTDHNTNIERTATSDTQSRSTLAMIRRLSGAYLLPYKKTLIIAIVFMVLSAALTAGFAKLIQPILDNVLVQKNSDLIVPLAVGMFAIFACNGVSTYIHTVLMNKIGLHIVSDIQNDLFGHFLKLDLKFFQNNASGQLVARVINDVNAVRASVVDSLTGIGKSLMTLFFMVLVMLEQNAPLTLFVVFVFVPAALFVGYLGRRLRKLSRSVQGEIGDLTDTLSQIFQGIRQVKAYNMEGFEQKRSGQVIHNVRRLMLKGVRVGTLSTPVNEVLIGAALMGLVLFGGYQVIDGDLTAGALMSFIAAFALSYEPLKRLAKLNNTLQTGLGAGERILDMFALQPTITDAEDAKTLTLSKPQKIVFDDVVFGYDESDEINALNHLSLTIPAGKMTAFVGPSGSGKTTAMNMVMRFYDPHAGGIKIGDEDIRDFTIQSLRNNIALVSQDITIFDDTVAANIAYGRADISQSEIEEAARAAAAHEFISAMPEGYDSRLGEHGTKLSGGQRQRIAIARALLRKTPILLMDEATSALDNESEKAIRHSLETIQKGRTVLIIAHRLSTVQNADQIIVLDQGRVAEKGKHDTLLKQNGLYAQMYKAGLKDE